MITHYRCTACQVTSSVELVGTEISRERDGDMITDIRMSMQLAWATCPACGARNPEGVTQQRREERNLTVFMIVLMGGLSIGAYFVPWIVLGWLGLFGAFYVYFLVKQPRWSHVFSLATILALGTLVWLAPRWAFVIVAIPTVQMLVHRRDPEEADRPWKQAAEQFRFFDTAARRP